MKIRILPMLDDPANKGLKTYDYESDYVPVRGQLVVFEGWHRVVADVAVHYSSEPGGTYALVTIRKFRK